MLKFVDIAVVDVVLDGMWTDTTRARIVWEYHDATGNDKRKVRQVDWSKSRDRGMRLLLEAGAGAPPTGSPV
ncbi:unnamed protein product, partial [Brenthis ino]